MTWIQVLALAMLASSVLDPVPVHAQAEAPLTRIAFGSCAHQDQPQPIWDAVLDYRPELFLFAGDNVYGDAGPGCRRPARRRLCQGEPESRASGRCASGCRCSRPGTTTTTARTTPAAIFHTRNEAKALFLDFWQIPADDPRRTREGIYHAAGVRARRACACR